MTARDIGLAVIVATPLRGPGATVDEIHATVRREHPGVTRDAVEAILTALVASRAAWFNGPKDRRRYARHH